LLPVDPQLAVKSTVKAANPDRERYRTLETMTVLPGRVNGPPPLTFR
jgi:hypothetical protein